MSLAEQLEVASDERWRVLLELQEQALAAGNAEDRLDGLLEAVGEVFGADRTCLVLMHGDGSSSVIGGRGPERALTLREREEVSKTVIRTALCKEAGIACLEDRATSAAGYASAAACFERAGLPVHELVARRAKASAGDDLLQIEGSLSALGIANPARYARMLAPGS